MTHNLSNSDLHKLKQNVYGFLPGIRIEDLEYILDHASKLDMYQTDWDIPQKGDLVRIEFQAGDVYEGVVTERKNGLLVTPRFVFTDEPMNSSDQPMKGNALFYRPATRHPDPAKSPVILVREILFTQPFHLQRFASPVPFVWDGDQYASLNGPLMKLQPKDITDWSQGRITEDEDD